MNRRDFLSGLTCLVTAAADASGQGNAPLLNDAVAAWDLADGGTGDRIKSALPNGPEGQQRWGIWLKDVTFGRVLDFSTEGSYVRVSGAGLVLGDRFSLSVWIKAPIRGETERVIISQGTGTTTDWQLLLSRQGTLAFRSPQFVGNTDSGCRLDDGRWHHVLVTRDHNRLTYFIDRVKARTLTVSGSIVNSSSDVYIGSNPDTANGFEGSLSRVRFYRGIKTPEQVTAFAAPNTGHQPAEPTLKMKHGIALDRRQYADYIPPEYEKVYPQDVANCRNMGFDHMKVLFTPNHLMRPDGSLVFEKLSYMKEVVDRVTAGWDELPDLPSSGSPF